MHVCILSNFLKLLTVASGNTARDQQDLNNVKHLTLFTDVTLILCVLQRGCCVSSNEIVLKLSSN